MFTDIASDCWHMQALCFSLFTPITVPCRKGVKSPGRVCQPPPHYRLPDHAPDMSGAWILGTGVAAALAQNSHARAHSPVLSAICWLFPADLCFHWGILQAAGALLWSACARHSPSPEWIVLDLFNLFRSLIRRFEATHLSINHNLSCCSQVLWNAASALSPCFTIS